MTRLRLAASIGLLLLHSTTVPAATQQASAPAEAAARVAREHPQCRGLGDFYWEIGNATGVQASGSVGGDVGADSELRIASASKFVWAAYVLEKIGRDKQPTDEQVAALQMRAGYTRFNPIFCALSRSVEACMNARSNAEREPSKVGRFAYGGGHDQRLAVELGLGRMSATELTAEVKRYVGQDLGFSYHSPQLAGGMESTPREFGKFLRKVVSGQLRLKQFLGYKPVCARPGSSCPNAVESPVKENWHYSLNHWVEDDPRTGDGAFSSPGLMGFYPWISADKSTYGILARQKLSASAYWDSVLCGREIRRAWMAQKGQ